MPKEERRREFVQAALEGGNFRAMVAERARIAMDMLDRKGVLRRAGPNDLIPETEMKWALREAERLLGPPTITVTLETPPANDGMPLEALELFEAAKYVEAFWPAMKIEMDPELDHDGKGVDEFEEGIKRLIDCKERFEATLRGGKLRETVVGLLEGITNDLGDAPGSLKTGTLFGRLVDYAVEEGWMVREEKKPDAE